MVQDFTNLKKRPKLEGEIYFIDLQHNNNYKGRKIFTYSKERVVLKGKLKCPPPHHVWR